MNRAERRRAQRAGKTDRPAAITYYSNSVWAGTGYGTQTYQSVKRLQADGHEVAVASNYGLQATKMVYDGIPHFPMGVDGYSNDVIEPIYTEWSQGHPDMPSLVIALFDAWPLKGPAWDRMPVGIWTMVDHLPVPPAVQAFLSKPNVTPLAASRFAHEQIQKAGIESLYLPMAIDTKLFKPTSTWSNEGSPVTGRQLMGFDEDVFVVSLINANKAGGNVHRKAWAENLLAFSIFAEGKDDVRVYLHTEATGAYGGINFAPLLDSLGIKKHQFRFVNQWANHCGIPTEAMPALFTATDVLLAATYGEGFGLTTLEAAACGTVSILNDFTCQPELQAEGWLTTGQPWWDNAQAAWWNIPNVGSIVEALEAAYARGRHRSQAQIDLAQQYDADKVYAEHWRPAINYLLDKHYATPAAEPLPVVEGDDAPALTVYIPTYRRPEQLAVLLDALVPQCGPDVEVIVADDDPEASGRAACDAHPTVTYLHRGTNLGGDENLQRGYEEARGRWVWMIGDDDCPLPGSVKSILEVAHSTDADRLILLSPHAPTGAAGCEGTPGALEAKQPGLSIASTLITANVVRRSALNLAAGRAEINSMYGWAFTFAGIRRCRVLASPCFEVGVDHAGEYVQSRGKGDAEVFDTWRRLMVAQGVPFKQSALSWNHVNVTRAAA